MTPEQFDIYWRARVAFRSLPDVRIRTVDRASDFLVIVTDEAGVRCPPQLAGVIPKMRNPSLQLAARAITVAQLRLAWGMGRRSTAHRIARGRRSA
jgi:hypothetical protein